MANMNISFGSVVVPSAGTPVRITVNQVDPTASVLAHALLIQPLTNNTGRIYIGNNASFIKNGTGQIAWLPAPSVNVAPAFSETISYAENAMEANELYIDVDNSGEGVIASGVRA
jgi:hypothetical protein